MCTITIKNNNRRFLNIRFIYTGKREHEEIIAKYCNRKSLVAFENENANAFKRSIHLKERRDIDMGVILILYAYMW